ncbi:monovalent cation/H+ antiporter complex subunit F [Mycobacterium shimoidei]|uniref:Uncharacterized protein n=1 Tax=Mycobacterium shimoidei TaxID=29313 RepID=A0A1E3T478_MYCSH|nr:monovalent cation/H+ antiporter complex subunit F [Mycobacterium shimoidei]MCV7261375.1 hypothetical protein [Mycobacterium shimoidei]ODR09229.1 hypothetical protein BHQ16_19815 [Mycobacterium shimoidei]ORW77446.1 hypothetical protein AWC26_19510 [Mycobacterium shimoidei]SRX95886.1 hypothetical protein MSP7336_04159 [Mycobacterium shimoidei]
MNFGEIAALLLLTGVFLPGTFIVSRGQPHDRLVGLEFASVAAVMTVMVIAVAWQRNSDLIVSLVLALVTLPATLVFTRLLAGKP